MADKRSLNDWDEVQRDFSAGEVGLRVAVRNDADFFKRALLVMENYAPTLQGTAVRVPGTRYISDADADVVRIIPYLTPTNQNAVVELLPGGLRIITGIPTSLGSNVFTISAPFSRLAVTPVILQVANNPRFEEGLSEWEIVPNRYTSADGSDLGCWLEGTGTDPNILMSARKWKHRNDRQDATIFGTAVIPLTGDGAWLKIRLNIQYQDNFSGPAAEYQLLLKVGTAKGASDLWVEEFTGQPGAIREFDETLTGLTLDPGQIVYMTVSLLAVGNANSPPSTPVFRVFSFEIFAKGTVDITDEVVGNLPYTAEDLPDVQFIQSPYVNTTDPDSTGKELVFTHPKYPPQELLVIAGVFIVRPKPFNDTPDEWADGNYPAACASFNGRLLLGGSQTNPIAGDPVGSAVETVWGTEVGRWNELITPDDPGVNPDDSIQFTAIYRSPIQWLFGQKNLLVGARSMEYVASADGIFSPGDIGVEMHSTHGSAPVQPVGLGDTVVFASEGGTKVRAMQFTTEQHGWVAPDLTLLHPELFAAGIVRMVRMRNPHQIVVVVMKNGQLALLHQDTTADIMGWSRMNFNANVKDACVINDESGADVLILTIERIINGERKLYLEAITHWLDGALQFFVQSATLSIPETETNVITGLEYLEAEMVQVIADGNYLGSFQVLNGEVTLIEDDGVPILFTSATVGLQMACSLATLPVVGTDPKARKRYSSIVVRCMFSDRPIINGERTADRTPSRVQNLSQGLDLYYDNNIAHMGSDRFQIITVGENLPIRSEIVGIFGAITAHDV